MDNKDLEDIKKSINISIKESMDEIDQKMESFISDRKCEEVEDEDSISQKIAIGIILTSLESMIKRSEKIQNNALRYSLILEKILIMLDISASGGLTYLDQYKPDFAERAKVVVENLQKEFQGMSEYIAKDLPSV